MHCNQICSHPKVFLYAVVALVFLLYYRVLQGHLQRLLPTSNLRLNASQRRWDTENTNHGELNLTPSNISLLEQFQKKIRILFWTTRLGRAIQVKGEFAKITDSCHGRCEFTTQKSLIGSSHAIIFYGSPKDLYTRWNESTSVFEPEGIPRMRDDRQFYIYYADLKERIVQASKNLHMYQAYEHFFNWTMTYRLDSHFPFALARFVPLTPEERSAYNATTDKAKVLSGKSELVAWAVSNCDRSMSNRQDLATALQQYIPVHIYGQCGNYTCPPKHEGPLSCHQHLGKKYKFYLAFENAQCLDYVTEKFFNALLVNMVPVVYRKANYGHRFPPGSFINLDSFASARALANHLQFLDQNDDEYFRYFAWKKEFQVMDWDIGETFCKLCDRVHREFGGVKSTVRLRQWLFNASDIAPTCTEMQQW